jgi:CheY-like chemotaxis protein
MPAKPLKRILVIDDDPLFLRAFCEILRREGYAVDSATGGRAGIDAFEAALNTAGPFTAVITDYGMRVVDGRQVAVEINRFSPATPVILITGWDQWFEGPEDASLPVVCILKKPPKLHELRHALAKYVDSPQA